MDVWPGFNTRMMGTIWPIEICYPFSAVIVLTIGFYLLDLMYQELSSWLFINKMKCHPNRQKEQAFRKGGELTHERDLMRILKLREEAARLCPSFEELVRKRAHETRIQCARQRWRDSVMMMNFCRTEWLTDKFNETVARLRNLRYCTLCN